MSYGFAKSPSAALHSPFVTAACPHPILLPEGEGVPCTLSHWERVAKGRVRGLIPQDSQALHLELFAVPEGLPEVRS
jgi:hypothetical protein